MKYLKLFNTHTKYETHSSEEMILPNVSKCILEDEVHYNPWTWAEEYLTFVAKESGTFTFTPQNSNVISYSTDEGETWTQGNSVDVSNGDKVMWKGTMTPSSTGIGTFSSTAEFDIQGNIMSLLYGSNYKGQTDLTGKNYVFWCLFKNNTKVVSIENLSLPATTLSTYCYYGMFYGCTSLVTIPELPATILADHCYNKMFRDCTSLTTAPELPATTLAEACYYYMFGGCTNLISAPTLPATTLANYCYQSMFYGCTGLTTAPLVLPATTLAEYCYTSMFGGCTSLTIASKLPATILPINCYGGMFYGCTSLTTAPELPATTLVQNCYRGMFRDCTNLNYIKAMFTTTPSVTYTDYWVGGVASSGTFVKNSAATWTTTGVNGVPTSWAIQTASA